jgi:hypothetical protein
MDECRYCCVPGADVCAECASLLARVVRELMEKNRAGDMTPPEHSDDDEWPLL